MTNSPDQFSKCIDFPSPHSYTYLPDKALVLIWKSDQFFISIGCAAFDWPSAFNYEWPWNSQCISAFDMFEETTSIGWRWSESSIQWQYRNHWYVFPCFQLQSIKNHLWIVFTIITWKVPIYFYSNRLSITLNNVTFTLSYTFIISKQIPPILIFQGASHFFPQREWRQCVIFTRNKIQ